MTLCKSGEKPFSLSVFDEQRVNPMTPLSESRKRDITTFAFAAIYIAVGILLTYLDLTGVISSTLFAVGIFLLIAASLVFKYVNDFLKKKK